MQTLFFYFNRFRRNYIVDVYRLYYQKTKFKGSCGGLSSLGIDKACDCDKPCDTLQSKLDAGDEQAKAEYEQKFAKKR